jgi:16S rRNA (guanine527-N7)-methyltransferase
LPAIAQNERWKSNESNYIWGMTNTIEVLQKYFPDLSETQQKQFESLQPLYAEWNEKINVISRKDIDNLYVNHVLHSLGIAKVATFLPGSDVLDVGTGGGFPGIPLAILFPETKFHLVDSIGKKIKVVEAVAAGAGLKNITTAHIRAEEVKSKYDFVVSRAVTRMNEFYEWVSDKFKKENRHALRNGILYLKGGDLTDEMAELAMRYQSFNLTDYFQEEFFETKKVIYVPVK